MKRAVIAVAVALLALLASAPDALAQELCSDFEQAFSIPESFPLNGGDWVIAYDEAEVAEPDPETDIDDDGFRMHTNVDTGGGHSVRFTLLFASPVTITDITADLVAENVGAGVAVGFCDTLPCDDVGDFTVTFLGTQDAPHTFNYGTDETGVYAMFFALGCSGTGSDCEIDNIAITGSIEACLFRPVLAGDVVDEDAAGDTYVISTTAGARVYAISDGLVESVIHDPNGYAVRLLVNGADSVLYTGLGGVFASVNDVIDGGCVLGYATEQGPGSLVGESTFNYVHDSGLGDWHDYNESLSVTPCDQPDTNCVNPNPNFDNDAIGWLSRYAIADTVNSADDSIMLVPKNGEIYQPGFSVAVEDTYYVTLVVGLSGTATAGSVTVVFAGTTTTMPVSVFDNEFVTLTTLGLSPAFTGTSEFRIDNNFAGNATLRVTFACLHTGDVVAAPPKCYFADANLSLDSFETESGAAFEPGLLNGGQYSLPAGGVIRSPIDVAAFADADTDFKLLINAAAPDGVSELTASIVDSDTDDELQAIGTYPYTTLFFAQITRTFTLDDGEHVVGDLYIENTGSDPVLVGSLCLSSVAGVWPGYENPDYSSGEFLPTNCEACDVPASLVDVVAWLNWIGCVLRYLIFCLLYTLVNNIWGTIIAVGSGLGLLGRWLAKAISVVAVWALQAANRILAGFISFLIPVINFVLAWLLTLPFVQGALDALAIAVIWATGIIELIVGVFNLFAAGLAFVVVLFNMFGTIWSAFISALSASSEITFVFPVCTDPESLFYDACIIFDVWNFLAGQVVGLPILIIAGSLSIGVRQIRKAVLTFQQGLSQ